MKGQQLGRTLGLLALAFLVFGALSGVTYSIVVPGDGGDFYAFYIPLLLIVTIVFLVVSVLMLRFLPKIAWLGPVVLSLLAFSSLYFPFKESLDVEATAELFGTIVTVLLAPGLLSYFSVWLGQRLYLRGRA